MRDEIKACPGGGGGGKTPVTTSCTEGLDEDEASLRVELESKRRRPKEKLEKKENYSNKNK